MKKNEINIPFMRLDRQYENLKGEILSITDNILSKGIKPGLVLHASKKYNEIKDTIKDYNELLVLCIDKPGESGQKFIQASFSLIEKINYLKNREKFILCVDGGLSQENISKIDCDKIVSASNVFKSINPKQQIISLQK